MLQGERWGISGLRKICGIGMFKIGVWHYDLRFKFVKPVEPKKGRLTYWRLVIIYDP